MHIRTESLFCFWYSEPEIMNWTTSKVHVHKDVQQRLQHCGSFRNEDERAVFCAGTSTKNERLLSYSLIWYEEVAS